VDGSIAFLSMGIGGSIDTIESQDPIVGFVFGHKGLIAGMSMEGTKFTKIWPNADTDNEQDEIDEFNEEVIE
jgi:lipid-binding SYLF domain-containing protein